jgi:GAF domain-containing protein
VQHRRPWIVSDMLSDPLFADARAAAENSEIRAAFSVPVTDAADKCIGSLACHYNRPYTPTSYDLERNRVFATLIAFTIAKYGAPVVERGFAAQAAIPNRNLNEGLRGRQAK